jgi:thiol-disulfide isomerase/thioredoxin
VEGKSMNTARGFFHLVLIFLPMLATICPFKLALAESPNIASSVDDLFRKAGISKINQGAAADFALRDLSGNTVSLSNYRGSPVLLNFWATWCGPCREEMPSMERLHRQLGGQGLTLLAINEKESVARVANFMKSYGLSFPALLDVDGRVSSAYRVWGLPTTYLIDAAGRLIGMKSGPRDWASREVADVVRRLGGEGGATGATASLLAGPVEALPATLRVKSAGGSLHGQQDAQSEVIAQLGSGEDVALLGKASGTAGVWYMIKSKTGAVGWIKANDLEETAKTK